MARKCMTVYCLTDIGEVEVRTFGGNTTDVRAMVQMYKQMTQEHFFLRHPKYRDLCKSAFGIRVSGDYA